ncbi:hypothetical protein OG984_09730 [Nocardioides sp. NBC_00368]|uniref:hypothetical protein n=1 Tax=Nocardioides sp. NBC_00368 TaxID=2976000 RepID=UPI002E1F9B44
MNNEPIPLHVEIDLEITEVEASADLEGNDEPERAPYEIRLHSLHDAAVAVERTDLDTAVSGVEVTVEVTAVPEKSPLESSARFPTESSEA